LIKDFKQFVKNVREPQGDFFLLRLQFGAKVYDNDTCTAGSVPATHIDRSATGCHKQTLNQPLASTRRKLC